MNTAAARHQARKSEEGDEAVAARLDEIIEDLNAIYGEDRPDVEMLGDTLAELQQIADSTENATHLEVADKLIAEVEMMIDRGGADAEGEKSARPDPRGRKSEEGDEAVAARLDEIIEDLKAIYDEDRPDVEMLGDTLSELQQIADSSENATHLEVADKLIAEVEMLIERGTAAADAA